MHLNAEGIKKQAKILLGSNEYTCFIQKNIGLGWGFVHYTEKSSLRRRQYLVQFLKSSWKHWTNQLISLWIIDHLCCTEGQFTLIAAYSGQILISYKIWAQCLTWNVLASTLDDEFSCLNFAWEYNDLWNLNSCILWWQVTEAWKGTATWCLDCC